MFELDTEEAQKRSVHKSKNRRAVPYLQVDDFSVGQEVTWTRQFPWTPIAAKVVHKYSTKVRIGFRIQSHDPLKNGQYAERDVSTRRLVIGHWSDRTLIKMGVYS